MNVIVHAGNKEVRKPLFEQLNAKEPFVLPCESDYRPISLALATFAIILASRCLASEQDVPQSIAMYCYCLYIVSIGKMLICELTTTEIFSLFAGGIFVFPLLAPALIEHLKLTQPQLSSIALAYVGLV